MIQLGVFLLAAIAIFWVSATSFITLWSAGAERSYAHGPLIVAVAILLLYRKRSELRSAEVRSNRLMLAALVPMSLAWLIAVQAGLQLGQQILFLLMLWVSVYAAFGRRVARLCAFPLAYLCFTIPLWDLLNGLLQRLTVLVTEALLLALGVTLRIDGNYVQIPEGGFEIAGGCAGLHFLIVALAIAALYGELNRDSPRTRVLLLGLGAVLALTGNWIRVATIIYAGHVTNMQHFLVRVDHYYFGWAVFAIMMIVFFLVARRFPVEQPEPSAVNAGTQTVGTRTWSMIAALFAMAIGPVWAAAVEQRAPVVVAPNLLPKVAARWSGPSGPSTSWQPLFAGADITQQSQYGAGDAVLDVFIAAYGYQTQGKELVGYRNSVLGGAHIEVLADRIIGEGQRAVREFEVRDPMGTHWLIWQWYEVGGRRVVSDRFEQVAYGMQSIWRATESRVVASRAGCVPDCQAARAVLTDFWSPL